MSFVSRVKSFFGFGAVNPTMGGLLPVSWPVNYWQKNMTPMSNDTNATVNSCADAYAQSMASLPISHIRKNSRNGFELVPNSAFNRVMRKPNAYQTKSDFALNLIRNLLFTGNGYAFAIRDERGQIAELHIMHSQNCMPYIEPETKTIFYGLGDNPLVGELSAIIPQRDVLHIRLHCPLHPLKGVSPIENCALAIAANNALLGHEATFFTNMSRPSGVLTSTDVLNQDQIRILRAAWSEQSQQLNSGEVPIIGGGLKFQQLSLTSQDAQLVEAYHLSVEDIARAFRIPLPLIGDLRGATYNNVEQLIQTWLATGLGFLLEHVEQSLGAFFGIGESEEIQHDTKKLMRTDFAGRIDALTKGISGGLYAPNEARALEGLESVDFGDEPRLQAQVIPLSSITIPPVAQTPIVAPSADEETRNLLAFARLKGELEKINSGTQGHGVG